MGKKLVYRLIAVTAFLFIAFTSGVDYNNCPPDFKDVASGYGELTTVCTDKDTYQLGETGHINFTVKKDDGKTIKHLRFEKSSWHIEILTVESECGHVHEGEHCEIESSFKVTSAPGPSEPEFTLKCEYEYLPKVGPLPAQWSDCAGRNPIPFPLTLRPKLEPGEDYCYEFTDYYFEETTSGTRATKYVISGTDYRICAEASGICRGCYSEGSCKVFLEGTSHKPDGEPVTARFEHDELGDEDSDYWIDGNDDGTIKSCTPVQWGPKGKRTYEFKVCAGSVCESDEYNALGVLQTEVFVVSSDYEPDLEFYVSPVTGAPSDTVSVKIYVTNKKTGADDVNFDNPAINVSIKWSLVDSTDVISLGDVLDGETKETSFQVTLPNDVGDYTLDLMLNYFDASEKKTTKPYPQDVSVKSCTGVSDCDQESCVVSKEICQDSKTILRTNICIAYDCVEGACIPIEKPPSESTEPCGAENFCSSGVCGPCSRVICGDKCYTESGKCCDSKKWYSGGECCSDGECISLKEKLKDIETGKIRCIDEKTLGIGITKREYICSDGLCTIKETPDENEEKCSHNEICSSGTFVGCTDCTGTLCDSKCKEEPGYCCIINEKETWFSGENKCCNRDDCSEGRKCCENECKQTKGACCEKDSGEDVWYEGDNKCCLGRDCGEDELCSKDHTCIPRKAMGEPCDRDEECEKGTACQDGICCMEGKKCCREDIKCDDGESCTIDSCDQEKHLCQQTFAEAGISCGTGLICDGKGVCISPKAPGIECLIDKECASEICYEGECKEAAAGKRCDDGKWYEGGCCIDDDCGDGKRCKDHNCITPETCGNGICENTTAEYNECTTKICEKDCSIKQCGNDGVCVEKYGESCDSPDCDCKLTIKTIKSLISTEDETEFRDTERKKFQVTVENTGDSKAAFTVNAFVEGIDLIEESQPTGILERGDTKNLVFQQAMSPDGTYSTYVGHHPIIISAKREGGPEAEKTTDTGALPVRQTRWSETIRDTTGLDIGFIEDAKMVIIVVGSILSAGIGLMLRYRKRGAKKADDAGPVAANEQSSPTSPPSPPTVPAPPAPVTPPQDQWGQAPAPAQDQWGQSPPQSYYAKTPDWQAGPMKYCTHCGAQIKADAQFCDHCGSAA